jgi:four helix bundle protein
MQRNDLSERLLAFAIREIKMLRKLPDTSEYRIIKYQLTKSASSAGANYEEAQGASSKADFNNKVHISLKEMRGSHYWLKILAGIHNQDELTFEINELFVESDELKKY